MAAARPKQCQNGSHGERFSRPPTTARPEAQDPRRSERSARTNPSRDRETRHVIWLAETGADAHDIFDLLIKTCEPKYRGATDGLIRDRVDQLTFRDIPAQHWQSIRTSHPIEGAFATIGHRIQRIIGSLSGEGMPRRRLRKRKHPIKRATNLPAMTARHNGSDRRSLASRPLKRTLSSAECCLIA